MANFISTWDTTKTSIGSSNNNQVKLPLVNGGSYNFVVNWGDGNIDTITVWNQAQTTHTYAATGSSYVVTISGTTCQGFKFSNTGDKLKIKDISQWGLLTFLPNSSSSFEGCINLDVTATDVPDVSNVTNFGFFFQNCNKLVYNSSIDNWNVSGGTDFSFMLNSCYLFNQPLNSWDVRKATTFYVMLNDAKVFNQPLNSWIVSGVTNFNGMFGGANAFNQDLSGWDVSKGTDFSYMFFNTYVFNQDLSSWDVSKGTNFQGMFLGARVFDQNLNSWNVSKGTNFSYMFYNAYVFNQPLNSWIVSGGTDFSSMFGFAKLFNQNLNSWNVSNGINFSYMFGSAYVFNQPLNSWNVGKGTNFSYMFYSAYVFNQSLNSWNVGKGTNFQGMFTYALVFNQPLNNWNVSKGTNFYGMFNDAHTFDQNLSSWNVSGGTDFRYFMLYDTLSTANYDALLAGWSSQNLKAGQTITFGYSQYCNETDRQAIIDDFTWAITDGGLSSGCTVDNFCTTLNPYTIINSTCGNANGEIQLSNVNYLNYYNFTFTDVSGKTYSFDPIAAHITGLTAGWYFLTATQIGTNNSCNFSWVEIVDTNTPMSLTSVSIKPVQCGPFDVQRGRLYYEVAGVDTGHTHSFYVYNEDLTLYYSATTITNIEDFILNNAPSKCFYGIIIDNVTGCHLLLPRYCVTSIPIFSQGGIKKLWIAKWSDDLDYNYWDSKDDDYFLEFADTSFFTSTKIKEYLSLSGGTIQWYSLPVAGKTVKLEQKLAKVRQGFIFTDNLTVAISKATAVKWQQMQTLLNPDNRWIYACIDDDDNAWTGGFMHGCLISTYSFASGNRGETDGYQMTMTTISENKILTALDKDYINNFII